MLTSRLVADVPVLEASGVRPYQWWKPERSGGGGILVLQAAGGQEEDRALNVQL